MPNPNHPTPTSELEKRLEKLYNVVAENSKYILALKNENKELRKYVEEANVAQEALDQRVEALETPE